MKKQREGRRSLAPAISFEEDVDSVSRRFSRKEDERVLILASTKPRSPVAKGLIPVKEEKVLLGHLSDIEHPDR